MHELSLCQSIVGVVDRARKEREVTVVHLRVGQLRQVVPDTLSFCWGIVTAGSPLAGSALDIDHVRVTLSCQACKHQGPIAQVPILVCAVCGSADAVIVTGEEFMVTSIDLAPVLVPEEGSHG